MSITTDNETVDAVARARALHGLVDEQAAASEDLGQLTPDIDDALHETGLYGIWIPKSLGGLELDPMTSLEVLETVSYAQPSAGWVLMAAGLSVGTGAAYLGDNAIEEIFTDVERWPIIAGQGTRPGTAKQVEGGLEISGDWSFASGIKHGTHIHTLGIISTTGEPRIFVLPVGQATLIDNWDVLGLRATGSIDYTIDNVFVPDAYTHFAVTEAPLRGGSLYTLGIIGFAAMAHSGWAAGIGRRLLDELAKKVHGGVGRTGTLAESESFHEQYAKAEATYRSARALVHETWSAIAESLTEGRPLTTRQQTLMRLAMANITWSCHDVAEFVYKSSGTIALRAGTLQRLFRDMHAGTQHITSAPVVFRGAGRELAGLATGKKWVFLDLVNEA